MFEVKITIVADEIVAAVNNLAAALAKTEITPTAPTVSAIPQPVKPEPEATSPPAPAPEQPAAVPTTPPKYTLEMLATAGSALIDAGKLDDLMALLGKFGVDSLVSIKPEDYGAIATELRAMGARI